MEPYWSLISFALGAIIGSFLNVIIYRLHTGKSINTPSHCLSCGTPLRWFELFPVFSYLVLKARCRTCGAHIPSRYLAVELLTGFTFLLLWRIFHEDIHVLTFNVALFSTLIVIAVYDIRHTIIPNELTLTVGGIAIVMLIFGQDLPFEWKVTDTLTDLSAGFLAFGFFFFLWYISKGKWLGLGDAKLALPLGVIAGISGVLSMIVFSFWIGAAASLFLLGAQRLLNKGKTSLRFLQPPLTIKSEVPFAPFLILGFAVVHLFHADIFDIIYYFMPI